MPVRMDSWKLLSGIALVVLAVFSYYQLLLEQSFVLRFAVLVGGIILGGAVICWGREGKIFLSYLGNVRSEMRKVVWPARQQAGQMSMLVVAMVIVVAIFLGLLDWVLSSIMGWFLG